MQKKLTAKDLINIGIFGAVYFVLMFTASMLGFIPVFLVLLPLICSIFTGIPLMLFLTKVHSFGQFTLFGTIIGLVNMLIGDSWITLAFAAGLGLLADLIFRAGKYKSSKLSVVGASVFSMWTVGKALPMFIMRDSYFQMLREGMSNEYADAVLRMTPDWSLILWFAAGFVGGLLGALLGKAVLKKHFERAGIA
ncbi:hypothetical protein OXPF_25780 [Oxobacter pfennigii]|uniref:Uncharacterized protein n=2 Tax=Oxobacter pfennigii TaxID=36849 RepID=A0A0P9AEW5_9CLOT|nr:hypothetical protein OXPF_25780 [Oxobacter pfennigii]